MDSISYGIDISRVRRENAAASNGFFETAASPDSLGSLSRGAVLIRDLDEPIQFPFTAYEATNPAV